MSVKCKPGMYASGQLCYTNCSNPYDGKTYTGGFTANTGVCWQNCTGETTDTGATCTKKSYENSAGVVTPQSCPSGKELYGGVCYNACPSGYSRSSLCGCSPNSPNRYTWGSVGCTGPKNQPTTFLGMTTGWNDCYPWYDPVIKTEYCSNSSIPSCPSGYYANAGLCYKNCKDGYKSVGTVCWGSCPSDMTDFGVGCTKKSYIPSPVGGELPYGSCNYPISSIPSSTSSTYSPSDTQDLGLGEIYNGTATSGKGCVPNITGTQAGSGNAWAVSKGFKWDNAEFDFALGNSCGLCSGCYGNECSGIHAISGVRPTVKRKAYTGDVVNCCTTGAKLDGNKTCDPKFRTSNASRVEACGTAGMDTYCDNSTNYSKNQFCKDNYKQIPTASKNLSSFGSCSASCGGGNQTRTCQVSTNSSTVKALRKSILEKSFMSDREYLYEPVETEQNYYIYQDDCAGQPLQQECNTENCAIYAIKTNKILQIFLFLIFIIIGGGVLYKFELVKKMMGENATGDVLLQ